MRIVKINDKEYNIPEIWSDVNVETYKKYALYFKKLKDLEEANNNEILNNPETSINKKWDDGELGLEELLEAITILTAIPSKIIKSIDINQVFTEIINPISSLIQTSLQENIEAVATITINNETYKRIETLENIVFLHYIELHKFIDKYNRAEDKERMILQDMDILFALLYVNESKGFLEDSFQERIKNIRKVSIQDVYSNIVFFFDYLLHTQNDTLLYSKMLKKTPELMKKGLKSPILFDYMISNLRQKYTAGIITYFTYLKRKVILRFMTY